MSAALVIGAMKAGTTTLYHDLAYLEGVTRGPKESGLFSRGVGRLPQEPGKISVDVCADYTMLHKYTEVPDRVARDLGTSVPLIYMLRDPLERVESHLRHLSSLGEHVDPRDLDDSHHVILTSRYAYQVSWWLRAGHTGMNLVDFHQYGASRQQGIAAVGDLLGVGVADVRMPSDLAVQNASADLRSARPGIRSIVRSSAYSHVKPFIPQRVRERLKKSRLTEPADVSIALPGTVRERLVDIFRKDLGELSSQVGTVPSWAIDYQGGGA